jgi:O-antigen/teichoic acid export membrane protein
VSALRGQASGSALSSSNGASHPSPLVVRLATNTLVQVGGSGVVLLISFFTFAAVTRGLGPTQFGDLTAANAYLFLPVMLADLGFSAAVLRRIAAEPSSTEHEMRASLPLRALISTVALAAAVGVAVAIPFNERTEVAILIGSAGSLLTLMTLSLLPILQAELRMHWAVAGQTVGRLVTLGLTLAALGAGYGLKAVVAAQVVGLGATFLVHLLGATRAVSLRPLVDVVHWRELVAGSFVLGLAVALASIYLRIDALLIALIRSSSEVGLYGAAFKFIELSDVVSHSVLVSVIPPLTRFIATRDPHAPELVQKGFDVLVGAATPIAVLMIVFAPEIITFTSGEEYRRAAGALQLLAPYVLFAFVNALLWQTLLAAGRDRALLVLTSSVLALNVTLNVVFLPIYGFKAAAVITVVCEGAILGPLAVAVRRLGLLPRVGYTALIAIAAVALIAVTLVVPGPALFVAVVGALAYLAVLLMLPGTVRDVVVRNLLPAWRALLSRSSSGTAR